MGSLIVSLIPVAIGVIVSPIAIIAAIAVMFSQRAKPNSLAFLAGWVFGAASALAVTFWILTLLEVHERHNPPTWASVLHIIIGLILLVSAYLMYTRIRHRLQRMAAAQGHAVVEEIPSMPGPLRRIESFGPGKCAVLGALVFWVNPVDMSCTIAAGIDLRLATVGTAALVISAIVFVLVGVSSVAVPVLMLVFLGDRAQQPLQRIRGYVMSNSKLLNVGLLVLIGLMQLAKGLNGL